MSKKVYRTKNLQKIIKVCELSKVNHWLTLVQGESGYGKTFAFKYFALKNTNVFLVEVISSDGRNVRGLWRRLAIQVLGEDFYYKNCEKAKFEDLIDFIVFGLNSKSEPNLVCIDEGGFLSHPALRHFRSLTDRVKKTTGFILGGPAYFIANFDQWSLNQIPGMAEIETRIDCIVTLLAPNSHDKKFICMKEGIESRPAITSITKKATNYRALFREISNYKMGIVSRYENEWTDR